MDFLAAVNRVLSESGVLQGDDDAITSFSNQQHVQNIARAKIAIQNELADLSSHHVIPAQQSTAIMIAVEGQRLNDLADGFIQFEDEKPLLIEVDNSDPDKAKSLSRYLTWYPGDELALRRVVPTYRDVLGQPYAWYFAAEDHRTSRRIGLVMVPDKKTYYRYHFQKERNMVNEIDELPFHRDVISYVFVQAATRHFNFLTVPEDIKGSLEADPILTAVRGRLLRLLKGKKPIAKYGQRYSTAEQSFYGPYSGH